MIYLSNVKRPQLLVAAVSAVFILLFLLHAVYYKRSPVSFWRPMSAVGDRWDDRCTAPNPFEKTFGRTNIRMSRAYEGSQFRTRNFIRKMLRGESVSVAAIGGSVTRGHGVWESEIWFHVFSEWLREVYNTPVESVNGAAPASGSDYFAFCWRNHIPWEADLVLVELAVNDEGIPEHVDNMENLLRGLLDAPHKPAVILVEAVAFSLGGMGGGGGRMHLPVAQYFDVPVINQRHPLANHFARYPELPQHYFAHDYWGNTDARHINARGHRDLANLVASFLQDVTCEMRAEESALIAAGGNPELPEWPEFSQPWYDGPEDEKIIRPAMWNTPPELGLLPRLRTLDGWNSDLNAVVPPFLPTCLSTRSQDPRFNLTPIVADGWEHWVHPEHLDKPYWRTNTTGAIIKVDLGTSMGVVKMYSLRSRSFGMGTVSCWVDEDRHRAVKTSGWWDNDANIGRFSSIRDDLKPGRHTVTCELLEETFDTGGGHEFRIISIMSL